MAYTIKGLAKANECESLDCYGLADVWNYWLSCNCNDKQCIDDFKRLRKADRITMLHVLQSDGCYENLYLHILPHIY